MTLTTEGVGFQDIHASGGFFYKWEDVESYQLITETDRYYSHETGTYQENNVHSIYLILENGSSKRVSVDKFPKKPGEIIQLFNLYKKGRQ